MNKNTILFVSIIVMISIVAVVGYFASTKAPGSVLQSPMPSSTKAPGSVLQSPKLSPFQSPAPSESPIVSASSYDPASGLSVYQFDDGIHKVKFSHLKNWEVLYASYDYDRAACTESDPACTKAFWASLARQDDPELGFVLNGRQCMDYVLLIKGLLMVCYDKAIIPGKRLPTEPTYNGENIGLLGPEARETIDILRKTYQETH